MRLYHVSEESGIMRFEPRLPARADLDPTIGLVWAIDEHRLPNFLTPRNCPRVAYHIGPHTTPQDAARWFTSRTASHAVIIESAWLDAMRRAVLYLYEFEPAGFSLQDDVAGYYVAETVQTPVAVHRVDDLLAELLRCGVELRMVDSLWDVADRIKETSLNWSLCRMGFAQPRRV